MKIFQGENWYSLIFFGIKIPLIKRLRLDRYIQKEVLKILNNVVDITQCPKAKGKLRKLQIADVLLLKIFHNICVKYGIRYSLEAGTLLGAIRHKGFIPWDDDLDTTILYEDYERVVEILQKEFEGTNLVLYGVNDTRLGNDTLRISHKNFEKLNLDIFYLYPSEWDSSYKNKIKQIWSKFNKKYYKIYKTVKDAENYESLKEFRVSINNKFAHEIKSCDFSCAKTFVNKISSNFWLASKEQLFPLKLTKFEDFEFYVPNQETSILEERYGNWMSFPTNVQHHGSFFTEFEDNEIEPIIEELKVLLKEKFS